MATIAICENHRAEWDIVRQGYYCRACNYHWTEFDVPKLQAMLSAQSLELQAAKSQLAELQRQWKSVLDISAKRGQLLTEKEQQIEALEIRNQSLVEALKRALPGIADRIGITLNDGIADRILYDDIEKLITPQPAPAAGTCMVDFGD